LDVLTKRRWNMIFESAAPMLAIWKILREAVLPRTTGKKKTASSVRVRGDFDYCLSLAHNRTVHFC
ncbi:hypothetical protein LJC24_04950, partial [Desulfococcaceae bacterium OttesenSCG-928-F15]|nr:hypothetical protein [Desulfococcaceae bacterium OttesenSCG-928-F15]